MFLRNALGFFLPSSSVLVMVALLRRRLVNCFERLASLCPVERSRRLILDAGDGGNGDEFGVVLLIVDKGESVGQPSTEPPSVLLSGGGVMRPEIPGYTSTNIVFFWFSLLSIADGFVAIF